MLRRRIDPALVAVLVESSDLATTRACEELVRLRLLVRSGHHYEFANDLLQECVHAALPPALALAYHRRAADLTSDRPEVMAEHAYAAGDAPRAAHGWLLAGEDALRRAAVEDALGLLDRSLAVETAFAGTRARALLARGAVHEARTDFAAALDDVRGALALARNTDDRRLEMAALRFLGGDAAVGLGQSVDELVAPLELGLRLAADLGDRRAEADFTSRLTILEASRLRLTTALERAERGVARARSAGSEDALVLALDGLKTVWSYLGDPEVLGEVVDRPGAARARPRRHLAAAVGGVREVVRARRRGPPGRCARRGRRGAGAQPAQRLPGVRRLPAGPRRLVRPARRATWTPHDAWADRPSRRAHPSPTPGGTPSPPACSPPR